MKNSNTDSIMGSLVLITLLTLLVFGILKWTNIPTGDFVDWVVGIACFWWLMLITTVPWNMHFKAKEILSEAEESYKAGIAVAPSDLAYAKKVSQTYLVVAILLHLFSAAGLFLVAYQGLSSVGYVGASLALLLTGLRPSVRMYEYVYYRLTRMGERIKYPRQDVLKLINEVETLKNDVDLLVNKLDYNQKDSWASQQQAEIRTLTEQMRALRNQFENLHTKSYNQHQELVKEVEHKIASLSEDAQFLNQVRELIRFVKNA